MGLTSPRARLALLLLAAVSLAAGVGGGLARLGTFTFPLPPAIAFHGALMVSGFLGTVISLERAVALGSRFAYAAPLAAGAGALALLAGLHGAGIALWIAAPLALLAASAAILRRQREAHTALLAVASLAWLAGNGLFAVGAQEAATPWWYAFLLLTIAAERLELTRLTRRGPRAMPLFAVVVASLLAGAHVGPVLYGLALCGLAGWLFAYDIARRTLLLHGFARYAAVALLGGYGWLATGGIAWIFSPALRDMALHAVGLGFVFSMILAHAPLIVPVIVRVRMRFVPFFYFPLVLLHVSLLWRLLPGAIDAHSRALGGLLNAAVIVVFVGTVIFAVATREGRG